MKFALLTGLTLGLSMVAQGADPVAKKDQPAPSAEGASIFKSNVDKFSYSIGLNLGNQIRNQSVEVTPDLIIRGLQDALANKTPLLSSNEIQQVNEEMRKVIMAKRETILKEMKEKNLAAAGKFLEENAKKEGVKKMESGLQYKVVKEGSGPKPKAGDKVAVHYRGTLLNGTEFDASSRRGPEPAVFGVGQVIKGWSEALTNMNVGSKWELYIPPNLAYGETGSRNIEPNSALIFDVEVVEIKQPEPPPQPITSDIIKVPSKAELDAGAKIEIIKPEDLAKLTNKNNQAAPPAPKPGTAPTAPK